MEGKKMDHNIKNALIISGILSIPMVIMQAGYSDYLNLILQYLGYVVPIIDTVITFFQPFLQMVGAYLTGLIENALNIMPFGDYFYYLVFAAVIFSIAIIFAIKDPGYASKLKKLEKETT
jgi:hypothetical protein